MSAQHSAKKSPFTIIVLLSGKGSNLKAIIEAIQQQKLEARIQAVISDKSEALGLDVAKKHGIPNFFIDPKDFANRHEFDQALKNKIDSLGCQLVVLAGFMRILSDEFVAYFSGRLINIHPSLLPKFKGLNTHRRALAEGEIIHGCSVHYVSAELDEGPVIAQRYFKIGHSDDTQTLQNKVHELEHQLYPQVIQWIAENRVSLNKGQLKTDTRLKGKLINNPFINDAF